MDDGIILFSIIFLATDEVLAHQQTAASTSTKFDGKNAYNKQSPGRRPGEYDSPNIEK
jgi:hypothetical protein